MLQNPAVLGQQTALGKRQGGRHQVQCRAEQAPAGELSGPCCEVNRLNHFL